ncbi:hypothetical protein AAFF_G00061690 [Aldrovandia affinis]|uniref:Uncharacterized protein n=1 Tax=Aldrovandia affinis TaxID=143900 RepID=A0AAD7WDX2_9TELE|nr:hypothetical protein AAFF_G00061690 [Aldrovandia affinis]
MTHSPPPPLWHHTVARLSSVTRGSREQSIWLCVSSGEYGETPWQRFNAARWRGKAWRSSVPLVGPPTAALQEESTLPFSRHAFIRHSGPST